MTMQVLGHWLDMVQALMPLRPARRKRSKLTAHERSARATERRRRRRAAEREQRRRALEAAYPWRPSGAA